MLDYVIRGGQVVTPWGVGDWDVAISGREDRRRRGTRHAHGRHRTGH